MMLTGPRRSCPCPSPFSRATPCGQRGYLDGYRDEGASRIALAEAERSILAEAMGEPTDPEAEGRYWIGYYHGQSHYRHGAPPEGAIRGGQIPNGL